jgi:Flp pilus assembly protein TadD
MPEAGWTPEEIYLLADRGYAFYRQGCYEEAAVIFDGLVTLDPLNAYCRTALAAVCLALGDAPRATRELTVLLDLAILQRNGEWNHARRLLWRLQAAGVAPQ